MDGDSHTYDASLHRYYCLHHKDPNNLIHYASHHTFACILVTDLPSSFQLEYRLINQELDQFLRTQKWNREVNNDVWDVKNDIVYGAVVHPKPDRSFLSRNFVIETNS